MGWNLPHVCRNMPSVGVLEETEAWAISAQIGASSTRKRCGSCAGQLLRGSNLVHCRRLRLAASLILVVDSMGSPARSEARRKKITKAFAVFSTVRFHGLVDQPG